MGRHANPIGTKTDLVLFKIKEKVTVEKADKEELISGVEVLNRLDIIAKREGKTIREIYTAAFAEYLGRHFDPGNSTPKLDSFMEGGVKSLGQIEQECFNKFKAASSIHRMYLMDYIAERGVPPKQRSYSIGLIIRKLKEAGVEVLVSGK